MTAAVPPAAPVAPPIAAPLPPPRIAPRIAPPTAAPPIFLALSPAGDSPFAIDRSVLQRDLAAVGEDERVEADAEPRRSFTLPPRSTERDRSEHARAGGNRDAAAGQDVARDARFDAILDVRALRRQRRFHLQADHRARPAGSLPRTAARAAPPAAARRDGSPREACRRGFRHGRADGRGITLRHRGGRAVRGGSSLACAGAAVSWVGRRVAGRGLFRRLRRRVTRLPVAGVWTRLHRNSAQGPRR